MNLKKILLENTRYLYMQVHGSKNWTYVLGRLLEKMERDTPFISVNTSCLLHVFSHDSYLVGKEVVGPIKGNFQELFHFDFVRGESEQLEIYSPHISFKEIFSLAAEIIQKKPNFKKAFSVGVNLKEPLKMPIELRFYPQGYPTPKLTI